MLNIKDSNISFLLFSPEKEELSNIDNTHRCRTLINVLHSLNYTVIPMQSYCNGMFEKTYIGITNEDNFKLKKEALLLMSQFDKNNLIIKYKGENYSKKIDNNGEEFPMEINYYDNDLKKKTYILEGISFTLTEQKRYLYPKDKTQLKNGMTIEYFNNNIWTKKEINNIDIEYEKMYKLLMKYEKLRFNY